MESNWLKNRRNSALVQGAKWSNRSRRTRIGSRIFEQSNKTYALEVPKTPPLRYAVFLAGYLRRYAANGCQKKL
jgi:hypothetical protein